MKITSLLIAFFLAFGAASCAVAAAAPGNPLSCNIGPVTKSYGGGQWLVYGCSDGKNVVLVTPQGNPGFPFVFSFLYSGNSMTLHGEGTGNKHVTDAAFKELHALSQADIAALFQQAKAHAAAGTGPHAT
ncbi:hypothetical protein [Rhodanobacter sp. T12-5]|uniref:hypothetical protein n=1 Tax=Rhodanobacter sp. T12-5 TaxID=2024611 RepID=UPI0011EFFA90|nr:hypothetical protein [Rhodanobacter sp. T12-5]